MRREKLIFDNLHRLTATTLSTGPSTTFSFDALGNITSKADVGSYIYDATKRHQVTSTSNGWSFGYDANGNMTSGRGAAIDWTSYNYPSCIRLGSSCSGTSTDYAAFSYTPDRQYWKQVSNYASTGTATTIYVGGLLEKVTTSAGTDYRHMIRAGSSTIIVSRQSSGTNSVYYVTSDHLGSSSAITNSSGGVLVNESFDAFGRRRGSNWSSNPSAGDWTAIAGTTRRGFTEHTMLDNLNLIHMNGRVFDPMIGRFLSADPFIDGVMNTQGWNRYSYVQNNPLSAIDPSGFWMWDNPWQSPWQNPCSPDTRRCWVPFPGHFYDGIFDDFVSQSRNARYGDNRISDDSHRPPPTISSTTPTDSADAWQSTNRKCPKGGISGLVIANCSMSIEDALDVNFLGRPIFAALNSAFDSAVQLAAQFVGPLGDRALQAVLDSETNGTKHEVLGTLAAAFDSNNAASTIELSAILAATVATDGSATAARGAGELRALYHGSDVASVDNILANGISRAAARELGGGDVFWATADRGIATLFAKANPAGGAPAIAGFRLPTSSLNSLVQSGAVAVDRTGAYMIKDWNAFNAAVVERFGGAL